MRLETRQRFVVGNWKLNGSLASNAALLSGLRDSLHRLPSRNFAVCVSAPFLGQVQQALDGSPVAWGAQDVSRFDKGAYTGEVSAQMVREFGATYTLVGHSERRALFGDTDSVVAEKFARAQAAGVRPILCVGETLQEREAGLTKSVVLRQLEAVIGQVGVANVGAGLLAYEPVWAIGTGKTATPAQAEEVHAHLRSTIAALDGSLAATVPILYGGSVKASIAAELFSQPNIDGGLVGGASLVLEEFIGICLAQ